MDLQDSTSPLSALSSEPSSPLSELSRSPTPLSPLAGRSMLTPPSSALDSGTTSPSKSSDIEDHSIMVNPDGARPAKRRKLNTKRDRTTRYINLAKSAERDANRDEDLSSSTMSELLDALRQKKKIVVIAGAGISVSAGIPDFRSSHGLFASLKNQHKLKASGAQLFDASVYRNDESTTHFHTMVRELAALSAKAKPTQFHDLLASLAHEGRLLRLYTQNIDCLDSQLPPLDTTVPLNEKGPWKKTVQLHGGLSKMVCSKCSKVSTFDASIFHGPEAPLCDECEALDLVRTSHAGKRSHGVGKLRPRFVLYNEHNPDDQAIANVVRADLRARPDAVIVVGTSLKIPGVKNMVKDMCGVTRKRKDGITVWVNLDSEPSSSELKGCWDIVVKGKSDDLASLVALPRWDETVEEKLTVVDDETMQNNLRTAKLFNVEIRRSTPEESASVKAESPRPVESQAVRKSVKVVKGIPTPTASPKVQPRTALPTAKSRVTAAPTKSKQAQLLFGNQTSKSKTAAPGMGELKRKRAKPATKKADTKPRVTVTNAFKATKPSAAVAAKSLEKGSQDDLPSTTTSVTWSEMRSNFQLRRPSFPVPTARTNEPTTFDFPTTPPQKGRDVVRDTISPPSVPNGMENLIDREVRT
ncbi:DHS-like NAD/FAD-binding domain-containing protein [Microdochium bolleyi]|uniref:DHS-like NAD/FAD-binding domain-containing protein n=1 Tax=Microdochium bolleyi TaxID=196109 RepID=A0A136J4N3_9PEZI|nr:DHS-like NAD/FAD-binding domain-containing protein [Microdochium bolleyi]